MFTGIHADSLWQSGETKTTTRASVLPAAQCPTAIARQRHVTIGEVVRETAAQNASAFSWYGKR